MCSSCSLLCSHSPNVDNHHRQNDYGQEYCKCTSQSILRIEEILLVKLHGNDVRTIITTSSHIDNIKDLENVDDHGGDNDAQGRGDHWNHDAPEHSDAARPIHFR